MGLWGRAGEIAALRGLVEAVRRGSGAALVVRGEAGIGKTALLEAVMPDDLRVLRVAGVEEEARFPYAALHRLLIPLKSEMSEMLRRIDGPLPDTRTTGRAVTALLAANRPLLCWVDDAQWIDHESLAVLLAQRTGLIVSGREAPEGLPSLDLGGLSSSAGAGLLREVVDVDPQIAAHLVRATGGNPQALLDLTRELTPAHLLGTRSLPDPLPVGDRLIEAYTRPGFGVLAAAAHPQARPGFGVLAAAAHPQARLGPGMLLAAAHPHADGHPLRRAAVYSAATAVERRAAHATLAATTTGDLRAWHRAAASVAPDAGIASDLADAAGRAGLRNGPAARVTFLLRAAEMSPGSADRERHLLAAAEAALTAGAPQQALRLVSMVAVGSRALIVRANALVMTEDEHAYAQGAALCLYAARASGPTEPDAAREAVPSSGATEPDAAREAVRDAADHLLRAGHLVRDTSAAEIARAARELGCDDVLPMVVAAMEPGSVEANADGRRGGGGRLGEAGADGRRDGIRRLVEGLREAPDEVVLRRQSGVGIAVDLLWDAVVQRAFWQRAIAASRRSGAEWHRRIALTGAAVLEIRLGETARAAELLSEVGDRPHPALLAWRGADHPGVVGAWLEAAERLGAGHAVQLIRAALAGAALSRGDYSLACTIGREVAADDELGLHRHVLPDLVEAAVRSGDRVRAVAAGEAFAAGVADTTWSRGLLARTHALLAANDEAEPLYREAMSLLAATPARADLARAHLLYGEWLRRRRRRRDARAALATAREMYEAMGAAGFAGRAARELAAAETTPATSPLTAQERAIADLAAAGATNTEIAAQLFLSANTVDHHLRKIFRKLDVTSRRRLQPALRPDSQ
ncbi:LuxR C-terminal-related transcriptional regulator [Actinoplanes sp. NPDC023714]|uniref:LuxR C-terminal-related transcriptional regulator n=1 Tax=Actinoplanes sp. NPDC023714 TaxID=3154322 RepID=UPI0033D1DB1D